MHPGFLPWWRHRHAHGADGSDHAEAHCGPSSHHGHHRGGRHEERWESSGPDGEGGGFGIRRPLRFLAFKLELSDDQVAKLARVLDDLKIERAQAAVDQRRSSAAFADALAAEPFDAAALDRVAEDRARSGERVAKAVAGALGKIHALLDAKQRADLAYLIRTGALQI
jgi:hypothetical protein